MVALLVRADDITEGCLDPMLDRDSQRAQCCADRADVSGVAGIRRPLLFLERWRYQKSSSGQVLGPNDGVASGERKNPHPRPQPYARREKTDRDADGV